MGVPFLGSIPIDPSVAESGDVGMAFVRYCASSPTAERMHAIIQPILALDEPAAPGIQKKCG
jgi:hypothetical protein